MLGLSLYVYKPMSLHCFVGSTFLCELHSDRLRGESGTLIYIRLEVVNRTFVQGTHHRSVLAIYT